MALRPVGCLVLVLLFLHNGDVVAVEKVRDFLKKPDEWFATTEAKNIAAINTDPDAPIFKHCRFGIVEDYRKVVPLLRQKLIALQNSQR